jgi:hypothetical protein
MQRRTKQYFPLALLILVLFANFSFADTVYFKDGRNLNNVETKETEKGLWVGGILFEESKIDKIDKKEIIKTHAPPKTESLEKLTNIMVGVEVNDFSEIKNTPTRLTDDKGCTIDKEKMGDANKVFVYLIHLKKYDPALYPYKKNEVQYIALVIKNKTKMPVELNSFLDEYYMKKKNGNILKFIFDEHIPTHPDVLNPNDKAVVYEENLVWFIKKYGNVEDLDSIYITIDNQQRKIALRSCF